MLFRSPQFFDLENQHKNNVELFKKALTTSRFWQLTEKSNAKNLGFYDTETGLINSSLEEFEIFLKQYPFLYLKDQSNKKIATLETASQLLWSNALSDQYYYLSNAKIKIKEFNQSGLSNSMQRSKCIKVDVFFAYYLNWLSYLG